MTSTWLSIDAEFVGVDKHGIVTLHVWAESPTGKTQIQVRVTLRADQIDAAARKVAEMREKYGPWT